MWWNALEYSKLHPLVENNIILGFPVESNGHIVLNHCLMVPGTIYIYLLKKSKTR